MHAEFAQPPSFPGTFFYYLYFWKIHTLILNLGHLLRKAGLEIGISVLPALAFLAWVTTDVICDKSVLGTILTSYQISIEIAYLYILSF